MIHFSPNLTIIYENITQKAAVTNIQHGKTHEIRCIASQIKSLHAPVSAAQKIYIKVRRYGKIQSIK